jgi:hypothetical protein
MNLREKHLPVWTLRSTPDLDAPLKCPELAIVKSSRVFPL